MPHSTPHEAGQVCRCTQVTRAVEMADGRLLVVAVGIARIRVCEASTKARLQPGTCAQEWQHIC